jgi:hypothetical protein
LLGFIPGAQKLSLALPYPHAAFEDCVEVLQPLTTGFEAVVATGANSTLRRIAAVALSSCFFVVKVSSRGSNSTSNLVVAR